MRSFAVGVIGHVDHGKTALVKALTGVDTDRLAEEKRRGISIVLGFSVLQTPAGTVDLIDMPGHERFVRTMVSGATGMQAVLLVVAANEGVRPQTIEHLEIARLLGIRRGIVALSKCDLVQAGEVARRSGEARHAAAGAGLENVPVVPVSAVSGAGLDGLAAGLAEIAAEAPRIADRGFCHLPIDRVFVKPGFGAVVTGTLRRGGLAVGDEVEILPRGQRARVRTIEIHGRSQDQALPGGRTAVSLRGVSAGDIQPGDALATPAALHAAEWIDVTIEASASAPRPLRNGDILRLLAGTAEAAARLRLLDCDSLEPLRAAYAQLHLDRPVAVAAREPFILRLDSPSVTVGGGIVLRPVSRRLRRCDEGVLSPLRVLATGSATQILLSELDRAGFAGATVVDLARLIGVGIERADRRLRELGARPLDGKRRLHPELWRALCQRLLDDVAAFHAREPLQPGMSRPHLLAGAPAHLHATTGEAAIQHLVHAGELVPDGGTYRRPDFDPRRQDSALGRQIAGAFEAGGLAPPDMARVIGSDKEREKALHHLMRTGTLVKALDRVQGRTVIFHAAAVMVAKDKLRRAYPSGAAFLAREAGAVWGISRKFSIPLLEHLDAAGFTARRGDQRIVIDAGAKVAESSGTVTAAEP